MAIFMPTDTLSLCSEIGEIGEIGVHKGGYGGMVLP